GQSPRVSRDRHPPASSSHAWLVVLAIPRLATAVSGNTNFVAIRIQRHRRRGDRPHRHVFAVLNHGYGWMLKAFVASDQAFEVLRPDLRFVFALKDYVE